MRSNEASGCMGGHRGFGEESMRLLMEQKKTKRFRGRGWRGRNLSPCGGAHIQRATSPGGGAAGCGGERERIRTGWTVRAHTDALCLMSR